VWFNILTHPEELIDLILSVPFDYQEPGDDQTNLEYWKTQKAIYAEEKNNPYSLRGAFATLFLNRTNRSGIISGGPIGGWTQQKTKISARFNKQTLMTKIKQIFAAKDSIHLTNIDAIALIPELPKKLPKTGSFLFFDPPYVKQGGHLYYSSLSPTDHRLLAQEILALEDFNWIVTYDPDPLIREAYSSLANRYEYQLTYSASQRRRAPEYLFASPRTKLTSFQKTELAPLIP
jgi:DNA adenine methylase